MSDHAEHVHGPECAHSNMPIKLGAVGGKEPCPCGSGKKYKHCCYQKHAAAANELASLAREAAAKEEAARGDSDQPEPEEVTAEARAIGKPKAPVIGRGPVMPPRNVPHGSAAKAKRSGHRKV